MKDVVQLAIGGSAVIGARTATTLGDLLASSSVQVVRAGSVVLEWPNATLPFALEAWESTQPMATDPIAFAFRHLATPSAHDPWAVPVDQVRQRVHEWVRDEKLRVNPPWPDGATCAIALVHDACALEKPASGLRGMVCRGPKEGPITPYERLAAIERSHRVTSALRSIDLLEPAEQAAVRALGFSLDTPAGIQIAGRPGFLRGTAFPTRGYDQESERAAEWIELPLLGSTPDPGVSTLVAAGGAATLSIPVLRFAGEDGPAAAADYAATLERLRALGVWFTTPEQLVRQLYT